MTSHLDIRLAVLAKEIAAKEQPLSYEAFEKGDFVVAQDSVAEKVADTRPPPVAPLPVFKPGDKVRVTATNSMLTGKSLLVVCRYGHDDQYGCNYADDKNLVSVYVFHASELSLIQPKAVRTDDGWVHCGVGNCSLPIGTRIHYKYRLRNGTLATFFVAHEVTATSALSIIESYMVVA
jgi:hypothetical protein